MSGVDRSPTSMGFLRNDTIRKRLVCLLGAMGHSTHVSHRSTTASEKGNMCLQVLIHTLCVCIYIYTDICRFTYLTWHLSLADCFPVYIEKSHIITLIRILSLSRVLHLSKALAFQDGHVPTFCLPPYHRRELYLGS